MIKSHSLSRIKQLNLFQAIKNILTFLQLANLADLKLEKVYNELLIAFNAFDEAIIRARKTGLTDALGELDSLRDNLYRTLLSFVKGCAKMPVENKAAAAKSLLEVFLKYPNNLPSLPAREQTAAIINLLQDLSKSPYTAQLTLIGARELVTLLGEKNTEFENCYLARTDKASQVELELGKKTRADIEEAFRNLAFAINGLEQAFGEEPYKTLSDQINKEVEQAKR